MNEIVSLYSKSQQGGDLPYFVGKQYGSGWFRNLARMAFPFLKRFGKVAVDTAKDVLMGDQPILPSLKRHAMDAARETLPVMSNLLKSKLGSNEEEETEPKPKPSINNRKRMKKTIFS